MSKLQKQQAKKQKKERKKKDLRFFHKKEESRGPHTCAKKLIPQVKNLSNCPPWSNTTRNDTWNKTEVSLGARPTCFSDETNFPQKPKSRFSLLVSSILAMVLFKKLSNCSSPQRHDQYTSFKGSSLSLGIVSKQCRNERATTRFFHIEFSFSCLYSHHFGMTFYEMQNSCKRQTQIFAVLACFLKNCTIHLLWRRKAE